MPLLDMLGYPEGYDPLTYAGGESPAMQATNGLPPQMTAQAPAPMMAPNGQPLGMLNNGGGDGFNMPAPSPWPSPVAPPSMPQPAPGISGAASAPGPAPQQAPPSQAPADVPETSLAGRLFGGAGDFINNHRSTLAAVGASMIGAQPGQIGQRLSATIGPATQADVRQSQQNMTVAALMKRGMPQDVAIAAATNPAIMSQLLPQLFGAKQLTPTPIGTDVLGHPIHGSFNPVTGKYYDVSGREVGANGQPVAGNVGGVGGVGTAGASAVTDPAKWATMSPDERLKTIDPQVQGEIKAIYEGRQPGTGRNVQQLFPLVNQVYPDFDAAEYPKRVALQKSYGGGGADFKELQALNTVGGHLGRLMDSAEGLGNSGFKPWNWLKNQTSAATIGNPALVKFRNDLVTTQNELAKAYHGGHVSDSAYNAFNSAIGEAQTPAELKAAIGELSGLLSSKITAKESAYRAGMAKIPLPQEFSAINDEAKHSFGRINDWASNVPQQQAAPAQSAPPSPGNYVWDPQGGLRSAQ